MAIGLLGRKVGMMRIYTEEGSATPVTVIEITPNRVSQIKTIDTDGYNAIQFVAGSKKASRVNKSMIGHFSKAGVDAGDMIGESRIDNVADYELGAEVSVDIFNVDQRIDVSGVTKGKGFAGTIKRHNFKGKDATHGNSISHRTPGSIGQNQTPGRVFKGKKMSGQMGNVNETVQNLRVVRVDAERNLLLVEGGVPGAKGGKVVVTPAIKA